MLQHYLKIAFRNQWKYKSQTLISVLGLAVGFTCFALATLWIRYEMTYDSFHKNAKQMYVVYLPWSTGYSRGAPNPMASYLKETFPEIEEAITLMPPDRATMTTEAGVEITLSIIQADTSLLKFFDVKIIEGIRDFLIVGSNKMAITQEKARQLYGNENPIGKIIGGSIEICAVVSDMPKRSNYAFDMIMPIRESNTYNAWQYSDGANAIIKLFPNANLEAFEKKLYEHQTGSNRGNYSKMKITPITKLHYTDPTVERKVKFQHIVIFAISGLLVILCALLNYLTLFVSRFRIRQKELALRMVFGASTRSLLAMLSIEFLLTLFFAVFAGYLLTKWLYEPFLNLSNISMNLSALFSETLLYTIGIILFSLLLFWLILFLFRRNSLNRSIQRNHNKLFRKSSIAIQLVISIGFAFCAIIILKQTYFLRHTDELGFSFKNSGSVRVASSNTEIVANRLKQLPEISEVLELKNLFDLLPHRNREVKEVSVWDEKPAGVEKISLERMYVSPEFMSFYKFRLLNGEMLTNADPETMVLLDENAVKAFGWYDPVGKQFDGYTVKGVIKSVYSFAPTIQAKPAYYLILPEGSGFPTDVILFKYREGMWKSCKEKIDQLKKDYSFNYIRNDQEEYDKYLKSETALIKLLSFVSAICILICIFGFVSLVSLTCEERRKAIAIRKINGATVGDILAIFAKEYFLLLLIGAAIAFPAGYIIMKSWLEQYVKQTSIPAWIYLSIIFVLAMIIVLCVGWQVYRASVENPAEVVKKE